MTAIYSSELLAGKKALVTGGGTGIGKATARALLAAGAEVVIAARRIEVLDAAADELRAAGGTVHTDVVDIRSRDLVEALAERHGDVDILVNNAGGQFPQKARDFSENGWKSVIDLNLTGTWNMTQIFGNRMLDGDGGVICQVIALVGRGIPGLGHTAAARAGTEELTRGLSFEWAPKVRLNCIAPGSILTEGYENAYDQRVLEGLREVPFSFPGTADDIANGIVFLVSPASSYVTGETLFVDGGYQNHGIVNAVPTGYEERNAER